jgi:hypothetical protein
MDKQTWTRLAALSPSAVKQLNRLFDSGMVHPIRSARRDWMIEMRFKICHSISAIAGLFLAFAPFAAPCAMAEPSDLDLVCSGNSYRKLGDPFPTTETVSFKREGKKPAMIGLPGSDKPTKASIVSSSPIQLKFSARGLTGEYFNFSGDLFLIHKDGRFTKLVCKPKA